MDVRVGLWRKLSAEEWCFWTVVLEKSLESPLACKEIQPVHPKGDQSWVFIGRTDAEAETPILWPPDAKSWLIGKDPDAGSLGAGGEGDDRGWDSWMASPTQWTWVWVNSRSWWWSGRPGMLQLMGSQRVENDWTTELTFTCQANSFLFFKRQPESPSHGFAYPLPAPGQNNCALTMFSEDTYLYFSPDIVISPSFNHKSLENRDKNIRTVL